MGSRKRKREGGIFLCLILIVALVLYGMVLAGQAQLFR